MYVKLLHVIPCEQSEKGGSKFNFKKKSTFFTGNNYTNSPHLQGGMKFATLISPLLNLGLMIQVIDLERHFQIIPFIIH